MQHNERLYKKLSERQSVCVSVRTYHEIADDKSKSNTYNTYDKSYYIRAMQYMKKHLSNPLFFICSDDIEWVKRNIDMKGYDVIFETGKDPIWEKVRMMYTCKHFVMSNSSFSWWTMWLSRNKKKIVVAPKRWYNDRFQGYLVEDWMIKM